MVPSFAEHYTMPVKNAVGRTDTQFVLGEDPREPEVRRDAWAIGAAGFQQRMAQVLGRPLPRRRGRPAKALALVEL
jgi:hypothetical protein